MARFERPLLYCVGVAMAAAAANCGGGERPPPAIDNPIDAGTGTLDGGAVDIIGYEPSQGLVFGDNGFVNCGAQASDKILTLRNPTTDVVNFTAKLTAGADLYKVNPTTGGVPARGQINLQVLPNPIPGESDVAPDLYAGTLEISFATGEPPTIIRLHQTARGAILKTTVSGELIDFGDVKVNTNGTQQLSLTNSGNLEVTASFLTGTQQFKVDGATSGSAKVLGGETASKTITFAPTEVLPYTDTLALSFNAAAVHCSPPPGNVNLKGKGTTSVGVSPGTLNYGQVDCGTTAPFQTVTISSTLTMNFTPTLGLGALSKFTVADSNGIPVNLGEPVNLAANVNYVMRVVPKQVPIPSPVNDNGLGDTLTITTDVPLDQPHTVALRETARGAIFAFNPTSFTESGTLGQVLNRTFALVNSGNAAGAYAIAVTDKDGFPAPPPNAFISNLSTGTAPVGNTAGTLTMTLPTANNTTYHGAVAVTAPGAVLCADLPPKMLLTASATGSSLSTNPPTTLAFGLVDCDSTAPPKTIEITSVVTTTVTPELALGPNSPYTLGAPDILGNPISVTANVPYTLTIVPKQVPIPSSTANNALGDTLTLTSAADSSQRTVALTQTARGAVLVFNPPSISASGNVQLQNTGNATATWATTGAGGTTTPATGTLLGGNGTTLAVTKAGAGSITVNLSSPGNIRCADLPTLTITN